jgi:hypothetical protein
METIGAVLCKDMRDTKPYFYVSPYAEQLARKLDEPPDYLAKWTKEL